MLGLRISYSPEDSRKSNQKTNTYSKSKIQTLEKGVKYVQS